MTSLESEGKTKRGLWSERWEPMHGRISDTISIYTMLRKWVVVHIRASERKEVSTISRYCRIRKGGSEAAHDF